MKQMENMKTNSMKSHLHYCQNRRQKVFSRGSL